MENNKIIRLSRIDLFALNLSREKRIYDLRKLFGIFGLLIKMLFCIIKIINFNCYSLKRILFDIIMTIKSYFFKILHD